MSNLRKALSLIVSGFYYDRATLIHLLYSYVRGTKAHSIKTYTEAALQKKILLGTSLIRMGDGEVMLMTGRDIHYQVADRSLATKLCTIIGSYTGNSPYILSIPVEAVTLTDDELTQKKRFRIWRLFRTFFTLRMSHDIPYADAHLFYHQGAYDSYIKPVITGRHVICVSNKENLTPALIDTLSIAATSVHIILNPNRDTYSVLTNLYNDINNILATHDTITDWVILVSSGPAGKVLAFDYCTRGIQVLDIGHGMEIIGQNKDYSDRI